MTFQIFEVTMNTVTDDLRINKETRKTELNSTVEKLLCDEGASYY